MNLKCLALDIMPQVPELKGLWLMRGRPMAAAWALVVTGCYGLSR